MILPRKFSSQVSYLPDSRESRCTRSLEKNRRIRKEESENLFLFFHLHLSINPSFHTVFLRSNNTVYNTHLPFELDRLTHFARFKAGKRNPQRFKTILPGDTGLNIVSDSVKKRFQHGSIRV